jgi:Cof subfamily protein (haloacid dehalogenase superfamily)
MIKAIFFDIDGTLVSFDTHLVPDSARCALEELRRRGVQVFIASGRHKASINNLPGLTFDGYVTINGTMATVEREGRTEVVYRHPIPQEDIRSWIHYLEQEPRSTIMVSEDELLMNYTNNDMEQIFELLNFPVPPTGDLRALLSKPVYQIITTFTEEEEVRLMAHLPHCKTTRWHPLFTDIIEREGSKAHGIEALIRHLGYSRDEIMAFGDGGNDVEMLRFAGVGVAMGNAPESVRAQADYVTDAVDADGVLHALQHFDLL